MHRFLIDNRDELIARCKARVAERPRRAATAGQLNHGAPLFLEQLARTLQAEQDGEGGESMRLSGAAGGDAAALSEIGVSAIAHGKELLELGYSVDQVVHDYCDLCQAITNLAVETNAPFTVNEFRTLNRCLDNAIADAVSSFSAERDVNFVVNHTEENNLRIGFLAHELRNCVVSAKLAASALEKGHLPMSGATGGVLKRSLAALTTLIDQTLSEVRLTNSLLRQEELFSVASLVDDARDLAAPDRRASGCALVVTEVDPQLGIQGNRSQLSAALATLLRSAFRFTHSQAEVTLHAYGAGSRILIDVKGNRGGISMCEVQETFKPFSQRSGDTLGLGLGLSMARKMVEADAGVLSVQDVPGTGCVFTISLPLHAFESDGSRPHHCCGRVEGGT